MEHRISPEACSVKGVDPCEGVPAPQDTDLFGNPVLGFNNRRITHTVDSLVDVDNRLVTRKDLDRWERHYVDEYERSQGFDVGVSISLYPDGEFSAACTALGSKPQKQRKKRTPVTTDFSPSSRHTLRRAVKNHWRPFSRHFVFTFAPGRGENVLNPDGTVNHQWAHSRISRVLATVKQKYQRLAEKAGNRQFAISIIRISELQKNGNIHFHVLMDRHVPIKYLVELWGQESNSVHVEKLAGLRAV
ncbi:MAG: hypothetical protein ACWGQW_14805, partial [bacterium]